MNLSALILLSTLWLVAVLFIVSFLAGAKRLRGEDEQYEEPLPEPTVRPQALNQSLASHGRDKAS